MIRVYLKVDNSKGYDVVKLRRPHSVSKSQMPP